MLNNQNIKTFDSEVFKAIQNEGVRQEEHIELIASENYTSKAVMEAQGSVFTNKYAEGYPKKRYYGGCTYADEVEALAIDRVKQLFSADYANVQPHSGSQANVAVYQAFCDPGDTVLGMSLAHGGHLTHGATVNFSGSIYNPVQYGIDENGLLDFDEIHQLAVEHKPKMIVAGFSAYSRIIDWSKFREIADEVGAKLFVDMAHVAGLVAAGLYPNPIPYADAVTSTTHKTLRGPRGGIILAKSNPDVEKKLNSKIFPGNQGGPLMHVIAAKAVAFKEALQPDFKAYQQQVVDNAKVLAETLKSRGYEIISNGTDNHMFLLSLIKQGVTGKDADAWLGEANITVNKNAVPNDPQSPFVTSGIRIGAPAITTRGFKQGECEKLANMIADVLDSKGSVEVITKVKAEVLALCSPFPVYA
jgi:glycine hydroxymethyltransferase